MSSPSRSATPSSKSPEEEENTRKALSSGKGKERAAEREDSEPQQSGSNESSGAADSDGDGGDIEDISGPGIHKQGEWQAIWSAEHNSYYFHNSRTNETTWNNPLASSATFEHANQPQQQQQHHHHNPIEAAIAAGVDPELAYLDPSLAFGANDPGAGAVQAKFNARTGAFSKPDARDPSHLGEWERMQRMSSVYFDTAAYEREVQRRKEEEELAGRKKKKVTKKDLVTISLLCDTLRSTYATS